jgi:hypothetical protein
MRLLSFVLMASVLLTCGSCNSTAKKEDKAATDSIAGTGSKKDYNEAGFQLLSTEALGDLKLGLTLTQTKHLLGAPEEATKLRLWGADGEYHHDLFYKTKGIKLDMLGENDTSQTISIITATAPCPYKTKAGIGIGSSRDAVYKAYNNFIDAASSDSVSIVAGTKDAGLIFKLQANKVNKIMLGAVTE